MAGNEDALIEALGAGVFERPLWHDFLEKLRRQTNSVYSHFALSGYRSDSVVMLKSGYGPPAALEDLVTRRRRLDAMPFSGADGSAFGLPALFEKSDAEYEAQCRRQLRDVGIEYVHAQPIVGPGEMRAWLTCAGAASDEPRVARLLAKLLPHARQALRTYMTLEDQKFSSAITIEASRRSNFGWLTLDARGRVLDQTPELDLARDTGGPLWHDARDRLRFQSSAVEREVSQILARCAADPTTKPRALILSRDPWMDVLIAPVQHRVAHRDTPVAILYLRLDRWSHAERCDQLAELFGLAPREAKLAWALAQGMTISEAARDLGLTIETARTYSKKAYSKTGARGQAELVRTILTSVLAIA